MSDLILKPNHKKEFRRRVFVTLVFIFYAFKYTYIQNR